jgi:hypothetical protein
MKVGTKSVLFGAHCFLIHPFFVAAAWIKLYGFPWDPRLWIAFFVHDLGYFGKPNIYLWLWDNIAYTTASCGMQIIRSVVR